ncbi:hypothetical protein T484DRAFT_1840939 [Baffinella frigidus]|nr:hypothetical protein T484DRAFT_1840939 [Cryptophyta sp. CCMP2293]
MSKPEISPVGGVAPRGRPVPGASPATHAAREMTLRGGGGDDTAPNVVPLGRDVHFESGGVMVAGFLVAPTGAAIQGGGVDESAAGGILMFTDVFGVEDAHNRAWMQSLCVATGLPVFAPDVFRGEPFSEATHGSASSGGFDAWRATIPLDRVFADISAAARCLRASSLDGLGTPGLAAAFQISSGS